MKELFKTLAFAIGMYMSIFMMYVLLFDNKQPNPQEIKVGSIVILGEGGSIRYVNPDNLEDGIYGVIDYIKIDTIYVKYEDVSEPNYKTIKAEVTGINTKDISPAPPMHSITLYPK